MTSEIQADDFQKRLPLEALVMARNRPVHTLLLFPVRSSLRSSGAAFRLLESDIFVFLSVIAMFERRCAKVLKEEVRRLEILLHKRG